MNRTLVKTPILYYPEQSDSGFIDDTTDITATMFKDIGVTCPCSKTNKIYYNKYTFNYQHCQSKKHTEFLVGLKKNAPQIIKTSIERKAEIKNLRVLLGRTEKENIILRNEINRLKAFEEDNIEYRSQIESLEQHHANQTKEYVEYKSEMEEERNKFEVLSKEMLSLCGYDIE